MGGEDWKSFVRIAVRPWEGRLNFLSVEFPLMITVDCWRLASVASDGLN